MAKIALFYGTQTGNTQTIAELIQRELGGDTVEDNQSDLTNSRVKSCVSQIKNEFGL